MYQIQKFVLSSGQLNTNITSPNWRLSPFLSPSLKIAIKTHTLMRGLSLHLHPQFCHLLFLFYSDTRFEWATPETYFFLLSPKFIFAETSGFPILDDSDTQICSDTFPATTSYVVMGPPLVASLFFSTFLNLLYNYFIIFLLFYVPNFPSLPSWWNGRGKRLPCFILLPPRLHYFFWKLICIYFFIWFVFIYFQTWVEEKNSITAKRRNFRLLLFETVRNRIFGLLNLFLVSHPSVVRYVVLSRKF